MRVTIGGGADSIKRKCVLYRLPNVDMTSATEIACWVIDDTAIGDVDEYKDAVANGLISATTQRSLHILKRHKWNSAKKAIADQAVIEVTFGLMATAFNRYVLNKKKNK